MNTWPNTFHPPSSARVSSDQTQLIYRCNSLWIIGAYTVMLLTAGGAFSLLPELADEQRSMTLPIWIFVVLGIPPLIFVIFGKNERVIDLRQRTMSERLSLGRLLLKTRYICGLEEVIGVGNGINIGQRGEFSYHLVFLTVDQEQITWENEQSCDEINQFAHQLSEILEVDYYPSFSKDELEEREEFDLPLLWIKFTVFDQNIIIIVIGGISLAVFCLGYYYYVP